MSISGRQTMGHLELFIGASNTFCYGLCGVLEQQSCADCMG